MPKFEVKMKNPEVSEGYDGMWRRWEQKSYVDLGILDLGDVHMGYWDHIVWVCTGSFLTRSEALKG
jgi:hypothetical protein